MRFRKGDAPAEELVTLVPPGFDRAVVARPGTSDRAAFDEVFGGAYELQLPAPPRLVFDLGANVGYASVFFALRHPGARVIAVEPEPSNVAMLRRNVAGLAVDVVEGAVWPRPGTLALEDPGKGRWGFRVREGDGDVRAFTVPELMDRAAVDFVDLVKLDVEGAELDLFSGDTAWLDAVGTLAVELHDRYRPGCRAALEVALARSATTFRTAGSAASVVATRVDPR